VKKLVEELKKIFNSWFGFISFFSRQRFYQQFGEMPEDPCRFSFWFAACLPVEEELKYKILEMTSVKQRLQALLDLAKH
jgi:ATP-dependent Lon protease